jgi:transcription antitermination factor NusG
MQTGAAMNNRPVTYKIGQVVEFVDLIEEKRAEFPISPTSRWYCVITNPNCQARAALGLHEIGYRTFYPKVRRWVTHARVKQAKEKPLFGRYIFVEVDPKNDQQSFYAVRAVNGVESMLSSWQETRFGMRIEPAPFCSDWMSSMRLRQMAGEWDETQGAFPVGAKIKLMEGEFANQLAIITAKEGRREKTIAFKLVGENRYGKLHVDNVRAA